MSNFFDSFTPPHATVIAAALAKMLDRGLSPESVLAQYEPYMAELTAHMRPVLPEDQATAESLPETRHPEGQADVEYRLGACPRCGADDVWGIKKCPHISPPWRTFLVCDNEACGFHGRSRLTVDELRRRWPDGVEED